MKVLITHNVVAVAYVGVEVQMQSLWAPACLVHKVKSALQVLMTNRCLVMLTLAYLKT